MKFPARQDERRFGLVWGNHRGHRTLWYEGGDHGFSSFIARLPDREVTIIILSNFGMAERRSTLGASWTSC